jgi:hypothetical protein
VGRCSCFTLLSNTRLININANTSSTDKNQYVHRRDSVSLANLTEKEIVQRIKLGLVTVTPTSDALESDEGDLEEWEDFDSDDDSAAESKSDKTVDYIVLSTTRRSSVDLNSLASNSHDEADFDSDSVGDFEPNKRQRSRTSPAIGTIEEETAEEEEVATVNGEDDEEMDRES